MDLEIRSVENIKILKLSGNFEAENAYRVWKWLKETISNDCPNIIINLGGVQSIDSTALSTLVHGLKETRKTQGKILLCCLQQPVRILLESMQLNRVFEIYPEEIDAVQEFLVGE